jgi:hypothetical protein
MTSFASKEKLSLALFCKIKKKDQEIKGNLASQAKIILEDQKKSLCSICNEKRGKCVFF